MKLTQSTELGQKRFNLRPLLPAPRNLWLLLVVLVDNDLRLFRRSTKQFPFETVHNIYFTIGVMAWGQSK